MEVVANVREHLLQGQLEHGAEALGPDQAAGSVDERIDVRLLVSGRRIGGKIGEHLGRGPAELCPDSRVQLLRNRTDVVSSVAVLRKGELLAAHLEIADPGADGEDVDLPAGIVDVVLAADVEAGCGQQVRLRRAIGSLATMTDV